MYQPDNRASDSPDRISDSTGKPLGGGPTDRFAGATKAPPISHADTPPKQRTTAAKAIIHVRHRDISRHAHENRARGEFSTDVDLCKDEACC